MESFEEIYLNLSKKAGKCRVAESGLGWKPSGGGSNHFTLDKSEIASAQWSRASKGYELKIASKNSNVGVVQLDGFKSEDYDTVQKCFKVWYGVELVHKEHALRGWNWGKTDLGRNELVFNVRNQPAFAVPYSEVSNTNLAGKNEVAVEFNLPGEDDNGADAALGGARVKGKRLGGQVDQLVEMRFFIPGTEMRRGKRGKSEGADSGDDDDEEQNAAQLFYETLADKAQIGEVAGDTFATFQDVLHLTPRGRFDLDLYEHTFRLRGKTYDYKVSYETAKRFFILPKPDDMHQLLCIGLDPPLRQGQTRYPFIVMQFKRDEEVTIELNMTDEDLETKYNGKLQPRYEAPICTVVAKIFHGLTGKRLFQPSHDFSSHHQQSGVKCSIKANEGHLFCLDRAFLFVPKPTTYISFDNVSFITMSRVGGVVSASRTFDITITLKNGAGEHQFSNINREEQTPLEGFFKLKNIKFKNEMDVDNAMLTAALNGDPDLASSEDEVVARGSAGEDDDESPDEDFQADSDSDPAEEYDSNAASSGGEEGSDIDMEDADKSDSDTEAKVERPKKKAKTGD
ncbi:nucleosome-binding factor SPN, POB3 subunit [Piedraia hortae CBS 480.64]|uniref:FACT complex subunit POB3 n=1 Tax=Piedraia hortae CBS 480.64 TaxID=1314780 RepID=A0A6A7C7A7_9PEZI|nr:nucleosome-binding factor SPN, POB3 subunit [Piedraia hortae CBS 480.64]